MDDSFLSRKALLDTCRKVREEGRAIFYAENCFLATLDGLNEGRCAQWLRTLGVNAACIKDPRIGVQMLNAVIDEFLKGAAPHTISTEPPNVQKFVDLAKGWGVEDCLMMSRALGEARRAGLAEESVTFPVFRETFRVTGLTEIYGTEFRGLCFRTRGEGN